MTEKDELKPCPFCGSDRIRWCDTTPEGQHWFACDDCNCEGPARDTKAEAIAAWSTRIEPEAADRGVSEADTPMEQTIDQIYEWAWETAVPGETSTETFKRGIEQALQQSLHIEPVSEALVRTATVLHKLICCLGSKNTDGTHYRWASMLSFEDGQEAMAANNANAELLEKRDVAIQSLRSEQDRPLDMCAHGADRGSYCGYCGGYSKGGAAVSDYPPKDAFHWKDDIFFTPMPDGSVECRRLGRDLYFHMSAKSWDSVVSFVAQRRAISEQEGGQGLSQVSEATR